MKIYGAPVAELINDDGVQSRAAIDGRIRISGSPIKKRIFIYLSRVAWVGLNRRRYI
jgi:hypothetical protein